MKDLKKLFISATERFWWGLFILIFIAIFGVGMLAVISVIAINKWMIPPLLIFLWAWAYDRAKKRS